MCKLCPLVHSSGEAVPKTMLVTPMGLLFEFTSAGGGCVDESLFDILVSGTAEEMMSYMLTPKEQEVLYHAYFRGYYSQPRDPLPASLGGFTPPPSGLSVFRSDAHTSPFSASPCLGHHISAGGGPPA